MQKNGFAGLNETGVGMNYFSAVHGSFMAKITRRIAE